MANSRLSKEDLIEIVRLRVVEGYKIQQIADRMGVGSSTIGDFLTKITHKKFWEEYDEKPHASAVTDKPEDRVETLKGKRFFFTCAQNNTFIPENFWNSLMNFIDHRDVELVVGTSYYNKNGFQRASRENDSNLWFDQRVKPFIKEHPCKVADDLLWLGELNILPTAVNPLSGYHNYTGKKSGIVPHCKIRLDSLPTHQNDDPKFMYTTGSVTYPNFIKKNAGNKAEHHHILGGLYVEIDDNGDWFARQIQAESNTGCFYDLNEYFTPEGVEDHSGASTEAINWGDLHFEVIDPEVALASFGVEVGKDHNSINTGLFDIVDETDNMLDVLKPRYQFCHDSSDFTPRNHHNIKDPHFLFTMMNKNYESVENALKNVADGIASMHRPWTETVIIDSNHDRALMRWLKESDFKRDPVNALFYLETQTDLYQAYNRGDYEYNIFAHVLRKLNEKLYTNVTFVTDDESFRLFGEDGIECCWHGDRGANGARGSLKGLTKTGLKMNSGHSHSAGILDGHYQAGVCSYIPLPYSKGSPTSWSHSHIVTYRNGKRTIVTIKNGKWRA